MRLAIADPPYPPQFSERRDRPGGNVRITARSRSVRWYGEAPGVRRVNPGRTKAADFHPAAADYNDLTAHRDLIEQLCDEYDGWALATSPDGLGAYHPLPISARVLAWVRSNPIPGGHRIRSTWEAVIVLPPEPRRSRYSGPRTPDSLHTAVPAGGFAGAKPPEWTRWVLDALGLAAGDTVDDLFPGSGAVSRVIEQALAELAPSEGQAS